MWGSGWVRVQGGSAQPKAVQLVVGGVVVEPPDQRRRQHVGRPATAARAAEAAVCFARQLGVVPVAPRGQPQRRA